MQVQIANKMSSGKEGSVSVMAVTVKTQNGDACWRFILSDTSRNYQAF
jgi:hypothetical protein